MEAPLNGKTINGDQLKSEIGATSIWVEGDTVHAEGCTQAQLDNGLTAHTADPTWLSPGPIKDWRDKLRAEVAFIDDQIATWPTNATTNAEALQRVNLLLRATKRLARNQARIMRFIDNAMMDSQ